MTRTHTPEQLTAYCLELAEEARLRLNGPERAACLERLESEMGNLRTALRWLAAHGDADRGLQLLIALRDFWRWHLSEGRAWFTKFLALPQASARTVLRVRALDNAAVLAFYALYQSDDLMSDDAREDLAVCRSLSEESLAESCETPGPPAYWTAPPVMPPVTETRRALRLAAATAAHREALRVPPFLQARLERKLESARTLLGPVSQAAAWEEGLAISLEHAIAYALKEPALGTATP
jgi:hypothetical protein